MQLLQKHKNIGVERFLLLALVFFLPFFFLPYTFAPVSLSKQLLSAVLILGTLVYMMARFLRKGTMVLPPSGLLKVSVIFFGTVLISGLLSQARGVSFLGNSPDSVIWAGLYVAGFLLMALFFKGDKLIRATSLLFLSGTIVFGILVTLQLQGIDILSVSPMGGMFPAGFVAAAALAGVVSFLAVAGSIEKRNKMLLIAAAVLLGLVAMQINFWSIWISLAIGLAVSSSVIGARILKHNKEETKPLLPSFFIIVISLFFIINPSAVFLESDNQAEEIGLTLRTTADITLNTLSGGRVLYGTGPGTFQYNYLTNKPISINETNFWNVVFSHGNSTITTNVSTWGVLGVAAFLYLIFFILKTLTKGILRSNKAASGVSEIHEGIAIGGLSAFLVIVVSLFVYRANAALILIMFLSAGVAVAALRTMNVVKVKKLTASANPQVLVLASLGAIVIISASLAGIYLLSQNYAAQAYAERAVREGDSAEIVRGLNQAVQTDPRDDAIRRLRSQAHMMMLGEILNDEDFTQDETANRFARVMQDAISDAEISTEINPRDVENWIQLGEVYENVIGFAEGAGNASIGAYDKALEVDPHNPALFLAQARVYLAMLDASEAQAGAGEGAEEEEKNEIISMAIEKINDSIALKSNFVSARLLLSSAYQRLGELDKAIEEISAVFSENPRNSNIAFQLGVLYWENNQLSESRELLEAAIEFAGGSFGNARYVLGIVYDELGNSDAAMEQFEALLEDNPENELVITAINNLRKGVSVLHGVDDLSEGPVAEGLAEDDVLDF